jgi:glycerophosphoryl diester phosphodiesterase
MKILSHRGLWRDAKEKNSLEAFRRSAELGFGTETDVRDRQGELVISHDMPRGDEPTLAAFLSVFAGTDLPLAINVKADGLAEVLCETMRKANVAEWFAFDMSIPDTRAYLHRRAPVFLRMSEVEMQPPWLEAAAGVWLDAFEATWYTAARIEELLQTRRVCVVSPELHGREPHDVWRLLAPMARCARLSICTDRPEELREYLGEYL